MRLAESGKRVSALEVAKLADMMARAAQRIGDLEHAARDEVTNDLGHAMTQNDHGPISVNVAAAKAHFAQLINAAMLGQDVIICRAGHPAVRLVADVQAPPPYGPAN